MATRTPGGKWTEHAVIAAVCALIIGIFVWGAEPGALEATDSRVSDSYYNLLVQGFRSGHLYVMRDPAPELAGLADPYNPSLNHPYVWDEHHLAYEMSYYKGKLYLYFGVVPALVFFWPCEALTGSYLSHRDGVVAFLTVGFLIGTVLLCAIRRRYFPDASIWALAAGLLALGLASGAFEILASCDVYEVAKSCAFAFVMAALAAIWRAMHYSERRLQWLTLASVAYGLAIGSRPSLLFGAIVLLVPVLQEWRVRGRKTSRWHPVLSLAAATGPLILAGAGLMVYNDLRFDNPFEFGLHYQLTNQNNDHARQFSLDYFFTNFGYYFLEPTRWGSHFPFIQAQTGTPGHVPPGYHGILSRCPGILMNSPFVWLALAVWPGWKQIPQDSDLRWFVSAVFVLFAACATTLCLFFAAGAGYELDFVPPLILLAAIGILSLEQTLKDHPSGKRVARAGWCLLLCYSLAFNILSGVEAYGTASYFLGNSLLNQGRPDDAAAWFKRALAFEPKFAEAHGGLGNVFSQKGRLDDAIAQYQKALEIKPDFADAYNNLGYCFLQQGKPDEAIIQYQKAIEFHFDSVNCESGLGDAYFQKGILNQAIAHYQQALEFQPESADIRERLGDAFFRMGSLDEAIAQYQKALEIKPDFAYACNNLGYCFLKQSRFNEAIVQFQKAIECQPGFGQAYNNLGNAFRQKRMPVEAIASYRKAINVQPGFVPPYVNLAWILAAWPQPAIRNGTNAVALAETASQLTRHVDPSALNALAAADAETGRFGDAVIAEQEAIALAQKLGDITLIRRNQERLALYSAGKACRQFEPDQPSR